jgi:hypothetical protein
MAAQLNTLADVSTLALAIQEDAVFIERDTNFMTQIVQVYTNGSGGNTRTNYQYSGGTAVSIGETTDLASQAFTPSAVSTLTPGEIGLQYFVTDLRMESDLPENIRSDAAIDLGGAARDKIEADLVGLFTSFTGGTMGTAGSAITWGQVFAAATVVRTNTKSRSAPLYCVVHEYQWHALAKAVSVAGLTLTTMPDMLVGPGGAWYVGSAAGINFYSTTNISISSSSAYGGLFQRNALAYDVRRAIRIEPQRDASRRGWEFNMTSVYAYGTWMPKYGVALLGSATAPTG